MKTLLIVLMVCSTTIAAPKKRKAPPLMPSRKPVSTQQEYRAEKTNRDSHFGFEVGILGRYQNAPQTILGMAIGYGVKGNYDIPVTGRFHFIPHLGYFYESEGEAQASFKTHSLLAGAQGLFDLTQSHFIFRLGVEASAVFALRQVFVTNQSFTNPLDIGFMAGPKIQLGRRYDNNNEWHLNIVPSYSTSQQFFLFLTLGFLFR